MVDVKEHYKLAMKQANRIYRSYNLRGKYEFNDILQVCHIGLIHAAKNFDKSKGFKFSTFACKCMYKLTMSTINRDKYYPAEKRDGHLNSEVFSLDVQVKNCEDGELTYKDILSDNYVLESELNNIDLKIALNKLPKKYKKIINLRYFDDKTQVQVSKILKVSQVQVSRLEKEALNLLKSYLM